MKTGNHKNARSDQVCLSKNELAAYAGGTLNGTAKGALNTHLSNCELCAQAAIGFSSAPDLALLEILDRELHQSVQAKFPSAGRFGLQQVFYILFGALSVMGVLYFFPFRNGRQMEGTSMSTVQAVERKPAENNTSSPIQQIPEEEITPSQDAPAGTQESEPQSADEKEHKEMTALRFMPLLQVEKDVINPSEDKEQQRVRVTPHTKYILDMKTYDYIERYKREQGSAWDNPNLGVPAKYEHGTEVITYSNGTDYRTAWRTYEEILYAALKEYKQKEYDRAIISLNLLLEDYPSDINGLFYKGLCLYRAGKFNKCVRYMMSVSEDINPTFDQEAEWYMALAYFSQGELDKARGKLNAVVIRDGFYKSQAQDMLRALD